MKHKTLIYYLTCILFICLLKNSYEEDDDNLDIDYVMALESKGWILDQLGITEDDIPKLTDKAMKAAKKYIKGRVKKGIVDMLKVPKKEGPCDSKQQLIHAKVAAIINCQKDPNNRGLSRETVYMYLSHYIDIPPAYIGETCNANDEEPYYANWITDDDRDVYESFIRVINGVKAVEEFMNALDFLKGAKGKLEDFQKDIIEKGFYDFVKDKFKKKFKDFLKDFGSNLISGKSPREYFKDKFDEIAEHFNYIDEDTPEDEVISKIQEKLGKDFLDSDMLDCASDAITASFETAIGNLSPITAAFTIAKLPLMFLTTLAPKAAVTSMLYSLSGRVAGRVMRIIEEDEDW
jgi:hypothetical protein